MNVSFGSRYVLAFMGVSSILIQYVYRLAVCTPIVESDKIVGNSACVDINVESWQNPSFVIASLTWLYSQVRRRI